jgi:hypothetical protein
VNLNIELKKANDQLNDLKGKLWNITIKSLT